MEDSIERNRLVAAVRDSEQMLDGGESTKRYLEHAGRVEELDSHLHLMGMPVKLGFRGAGLNYLLARKALWLRSFVFEHGCKHPGLCARGPSILLFAREAKRRLEREGRGAEVAELFRALAEGKPRDALRRQYLPRPATSVSEVYACVRSGRIEHARAEFAALSETERAEVVRFSRALERLVRSGGGTVPAPREAPAAETICAALEGAAEFAT